MQSLDKTLDLFIEFKFCESDFYFLNRSKNCMVVTYNFGSLYILRVTGYNFFVFLSLKVDFVFWQTV